MTIGAKFKYSYHEISERFASDCSAVLITKITVSEKEMCSRDSIFFFFKLVYQERLRENSIFIFIHLPRHLTSEIRTIVEKKAWYGKYNFV